MSIDRKPAEHGIVKNVIPLLVHELLRIPAALLSPFADSREIGLRHGGALSVLGTVFVLDPFKRIFRL